MQGTQLLLGMKALRLLSGPLELAVREALSADEQRVREALSLLAAARIHKPLRRELHSLGVRFQAEEEEAPDFELQQAACDEATEGMAGMSSYFANQADRQLVVDRQQGAAEQDAMHASTALSGMDDQDAATAGMPADAINEVSSLAAFTDTPNEAPCFIKKAIMDMAPEKAMALIAGCISRDCIYCRSTWHPGAFPVIWRISLQILNEPMELDWHDMLLLEMAEESAAAAEGVGAPGGEEQGDGGDDGAGTSQGAGSSRRQAAGQREAAQLRLVTGNKPGRKSIFGQKGVRSDVLMDGLASLEVS